MFVCVEVVFVMVKLEVAVVEVFAIEFIVEVLLVSVVAVVLMVVVAVVIVVVDGFVVVVGLIVVIGGGGAGGGVGLGLGLGLGLAQKQPFTTENEIANRIRILISTLGLLTVTVLFLTQSGKVEQAHPMVQSLPKHCRYLSTAGENYVICV